MGILKKYTFLPLYFSGILLQLIDSYKNPKTVETFLFFSSGQALFWVFTVIILFRVLNIVLLPKLISRFSIIFGLLLFFLSSILAAINYNIDVNYIYGKIFVNLDQIFILSMFLFFSGIISFSNSFLKNNYKYLFFLLGLFLLTAYYIYGFFPLDARHQIQKEDQMIESYQALFAFFSSIISFLIGKIFFRKNFLISFIFLICAAGLFFVAGDEISWGQRMLGIETPMEIAKSNTQGEITIHNHYLIQGVTPLLFMIVGLYGSVMWAFPKLFSGLFKKFKNYYLFIPPLFLFPFFFSGFFYNFYTSLGDHTIGNWSEPTELMLYLGVFFHFLLVYKKLKNNFR